jgi:hypothetical protein
VKVRKEPLEECFRSILADLTPRREAIELLSEVVRDAWSTETMAVTSRNDRLRCEISDSEQRERQLQKAYLLERSISQDVYSSQQQKLTDSLEDARKGIHPLPVSLETVNDSLKLAVRLVSDLEGTWNQLEPPKRAPFARMVFPNGVEYTSEGLGTARTPLFFRDSGETRVDESGLVADYVEEPDGYPLRNDHRNVVVLREPASLSVPVFNRPLLAAK